MGNLWGTSARAAVRAKRPRRACHARPTTTSFVSNDRGARAMRAKRVKRPRRPPWGAPPQGNDRVTRAKRAQPPRRACQTSRTATSLVSNDRVVSLEQGIAVQCHKITRHCSATTLDYTVSRHIGAGLQGMACQLHQTTGIPCPLHKTTLDYKAFHAHYMETTLIYKVFRAHNIKRHLFTRYFMPITWKRH